MRTIDAIVERLRTQLSLIPGKTIFKGSDVVLPDGGPLVTVIETAGRPSTRVHNSKELSRPGVQVTVRGPLYEPVGAMVDAAYVALGGGDRPLANILIGDVFFLDIAPVQPPFQLPNDPKGRVRLVFNVNMTRR